MRKPNLEDLASRLVSRVNPELLINFISNYLTSIGGSIGVIELMTRMNIWLEDTLRISKYMVDNKLARVEGHCLLVDRTNVNEQFLEEYQWLCKWDTQHRDSLEILPRENELIQRFSEAVLFRPINDAEIDQYYNTPNTNLRRLKLMSREPLSFAKSVCFLGDDDLTSLMFALQGNFKDIVVYDIDHRIVEFINNTSRQLCLRNYRALQYDYRNPPVENHKFAIFHSDPPATIAAVDLVLKRSRELSHPSATCYLSWPEYLCDPQFLLDMQEAYTRNGWLVTAKFPEFNEYDNKCFFSYITESDRETLKLFNLTEDTINNSPPMQRYCLTRLLLADKPEIQIGKWEKEIYLTNLHKIPTGRYHTVKNED